jgi:hypothetical protein
MTSWGTLQVTYLSPEQAKDPTSLQKFQPIYEKAKAYRGEIIEAALFIESRLDLLLCRLFVGSDDNRVELFRALILDPESCSFHQKWKMLRGVLELRGVPKNCLNVEERKKLLSQLKQLIADRNKFAHGDLYVDARDGSVLCCQLFDDRERMRCFGARRQRVFPNPD